MPYIRLKIQLVSADSSTNKNLQSMKPVHKKRAIPLAPILAGALAMLVVTGSPTAVAQGVPGIPAFLPMNHEVAEGEALPIDGVWTISTIGKRIRIERGRAYAVDPWLHLFVLQVKADMVVLRDFRRVSAGHFRAEDLPLLGPATLTLDPDGNLKVHVQGALGPVAYQLIQREVDDAAALDAETAAISGGVTLPPLDEETDGRHDLEAEDEPTPSSRGDDGLANCAKLGIDPASGNVVCFD